MAVSLRSSGAALFLARYPESMRPFAVATLVFGILSLALGIIGGAGLTGGKPSPMSLIAGGGIGIACIWMAFLAKEKPGIAYRVAAGLALVTVAATFKPAMDGKWNGITMVVAGIALFGYLGYGHMASKKGEG